MILGLIHLSYIQASAFSDFALSSEHYLAASKKGLKETGKLASHLGILEDKHIQRLVAKALQLECKKLDVKLQHIDSLTQVSIPINIL